MTEKRWGLFGLGRGRRDAGTTETTETVDGLRTQIADYLHSQGLDYYQQLLTSADTDQVLQILINSGQFRHFEPSMFVEKDVGKLYELVGIVKDNLTDKPYCGLEQYQYMGILANFFVGHLTVGHLSSANWYGHGLLNDRAVAEEVKRLASRERLEQLREELERYFEMELNDSIQRRERQKRDYFQGEEPIKPTPAEGSYDDPSEEFVRQWDLYQRYQKNENSIKLITKALQILGEYRIN